MEHHASDTLGKACKAIAGRIWSLLRLIGRACCRVAGCILAIAVAAIIIDSRTPARSDDVVSDLGVVFTTEITDTVIREQLEAISELAVYDFSYTNHVDYTSVPQILGHDVWGTDHWFAFDYSGIIKVGCNFDEIEVLCVDQAANTVTIHIPEVRVLSNDIAIDMGTYEDQNNVCNPLQPLEVLDYLYSRRAPEQARAIESGVLELGAERAQTLISLAVRSLGFEVVFE